MKQNLVRIVSAILAATAGACKNEPRPIIPEPGNPCGYGWHSCGNGKCCDEGWDCRPAGYCAAGGEQGPTWGTSKDGGAERKMTPGERRQLTPEEVRKTVAP